MSKLFLASNFFTVAPLVTNMLGNQQQGKKVLYIATAAECEAGDKTWLNDDRQALLDMGMEVVDYTITGKRLEDFAKDFAGIQYILVSGGNTFYLLEKAQQSGFITFIHEYMKADNAVYFGSSAGAAIAGHDIYPLINLDDEDKAPNLQGYAGFGLTNLCLMPHWGSENFKNHYLTKGLAHAYSEAYKLVMLTNNQFLYVDPDGAYAVLEV